MSSRDRLYFLDLGLSLFPNINGRVLSCFPDGSDLRELVTGLKTNPDGIAVDLPNQHIYWTNMGIPTENDGTIQRCDFSGENIVTIIPKGITHTPKQLVIAFSARKLYWSDREGMRVMRANLDGSDVDVLVQAGTSERDKKDGRNWCVGIAVDEEANQVYWTQKGPSKGNQGRILRTSLNKRDGESPSVRSDIEVLLDDLPEPIDLELDHTSRVLYWTDRGDPPFGNSLNVASISHLSEKGRLEREILVPKLHEGIGLSLDKKSERIYFGDLLGGLYSTRLDGTDKTTINADIGDVTGVAFVGY